MSTNPKFIEAILTNNKLTEEEKSKLIAEFIESIQNEYPNLKYHATKDDVKESELRLIKEIEGVRKETKEVELKLTKEIEEVRNEIKQTELKLTKEIEEVRNEMKIIDTSLRKEIKETELKILDVIYKSKSDTIKWFVGVVFAQLIGVAGIIFTAFKIFIKG